MYFVEKTRGINFWKRFDYLLFFSVLILSVFGLVVLYSATRELPGGANGDRMFKVQLFSMIVGAVLSVVISLLDYKDFKTLGFLFYLFGIGLLILVEFRGYSVAGSKSWIRLPVIGQFQPSELVKLCFIVFLSVFFERIKEESRDRNINIIKLLVYAAIPILLILKQPDAGTAMVFMFIFAVMVFICGIPYKYIFMSLGAFVASFPFLWLFVFKEHQKDRIIAFINPAWDPGNKGYNVNQAKMAIGSGQLFGQGFQNGIQTQSKGVPVKESDFIFSVIGEEFGFIGSVAVVLLALFILIRLVTIARNASDTYGAFLVTGVTGLFAFHFFENIGMNLGLLPVTGVPLPFVSQGGSAVITYYMALGIAHSVAIRRKKVIFNSDE